MERNQFFRSRSNRSRAWLHTSHSSIFLEHPPSIQSSSSSCCGIPNTGLKLSRKKYWRVHNFCNDGILGNPGVTHSVTLHFWRQSNGTRRALVTEGVMTTPTVWNRASWSWEVDWLHNTRIQKVLSDGVQLWQRFFFSWWGEGGSKYHYKRAIIAPPAKRHLNGVSLACRWLPNIECWLGSFVIFQGTWLVL